MKKAQTYDPNFQDEFDIATIAFKCIAWFYELGMKDETAFEEPLHYLTEPEVIVALASCIRTYGSEFPSHLLNNDHLKQLEVYLSDDNVEDTLDSEVRESLFKILEHF